MGITTEMPARPGLAPPRVTGEVTSNDGCIVDRQAGNFAEVLADESNEAKHSCMTASCPGRSAACLTLGRHPLEGHMQGLL